MNYVYLATSANNKTVVYDPIGSHAATHFNDTPALEALVIEALRLSTLEGSRILFEKDMGRTIGTTDLVTNEPGDEIIYAKRLNRDIYTSFNKTQQPQPTSLVAICVDMIDDDTYQLFTAWTGSVHAPAFPGDENETPDSKAYWKTHSLSWGTQAIQSGTETTTCPW